MSHPTPQITRSRCINVMILLYFFFILFMKLTIVLITEINIIDKIGKSFNDHLGKIIMHTSSIQKTQMKDGFTNSCSQVDIPVDLSSFIA